MVKFHVSTRLTFLPESSIRKLTPYANQAKKQKVVVYHLNIGDPDVFTPEVMISVLKKWNTNPITYCQSQGEETFLKSLLTYYHQLGYKFLKQKHLQITSGGSEAISMAMFAVGDIGDEIIVFEPFYTNYNSYAAINGIRLVPIKTDIKHGFHLPKAEVIEKAITSKTKAIFYCSPNNPTGTVYTSKEIKMLVSLAKKYSLFLLSDEAYREYTYDGKLQISLLEYMPEIPDQAIVLDSMSKRYSVCGLRIGVLVSLNQKIMDGVLRIAQSRLSVGLVDQKVVSKLTDVPSSYMKKVKQEYEKRRDILYTGLKAIPGVSIPKPEGAFYTIAKLPVLDAELFCKWLLTDFRKNNETVMLAPAAGFYAQPGLGKQEVRIAYVLNTEKLTRCIEILKIALKRYSAINKSHTQS